MHPLELAKQVALIIFNEEMNNIIKINIYLEESGLSIKGIWDTIKNETKDQKGGFLGWILGTVGASLLGNLLTGKSTIRTVEDTIRAGHEF